MKKKDINLYVLFALVALFSRIPFLETVQSHWDGPQYSIALIRYSFIEHTPTAPGYPLYIALGKVFYLFVRDPHLSILLVSVFSSIVGSILFFIVGKKMFQTIVGVIATTLFLTGSTFYYFSLTPYGYQLILVATVFLAFCVYRIFILQKQDGVLFGLACALIFGVRPQEALLIGPLGLLGFYYLDRKQKLYALLIILVQTLLWLVPFFMITGGISEYIKANSSALFVGFQGHPLKVHLELMIKGFLLSFGISGIFLLYYLHELIKHKSKINWKYCVYFGVWIVPGLLFNLFIRSEHAGYQLSYLGAIVFLISYSVWKVTQKSKFLTTSTIVFIALFNLWWFFYDRDPQFVKPYRPTSFHYSDIKKNDIKTGGKVTFIKNKFDPEKTLIISTEVLWRPYSYYLANYQFIVPFGLDNTAAPYKYNIIRARNWEMDWDSTKQFVLPIPQHITTIVFMDDAASIWIKNYPLTIYKLPGNSSISTIKVRPQLKIIYDFHHIEVKKV